MKLLTYDAGSGPRAGVLEGEEVLDASALLGAPLTLRDVRALLEHAPDAVDRLRDALGRGSAPRVPLANVRLRAPILQPPTVRDHIAFEEHATGQWTREASGPRMEVWSRLPIFYFSNPLRIFGPEDEVPYPSASRVLDYELELGCVIGREGSNVPAEEGLAYIAGFLIFNDWSARDLQFDEMSARLGPAKGKDAATSLGPWLVTTDELAPNLRDGRLHLHCSLRVNGEAWMDGETGGMHHTWGDFVERASHDSRVVPGDVFGSGTVSGGSIGEAKGRGYPARYLQPGDVVELDVEGIGILRNRVGRRIDSDPTYRYRAPERVAS
jgi:2-keto-4-pentenoate hydratase/2-oxohepta-3-ene-1,7-dioic acid hydratase in catechol pathway